MSHTCFCKPKVTNCPKCSKPDYRLLARRSTGAGDRGKMFKTKLYLRKTEVAA